MCATKKVSLVLYMYSHLFSHGNLLIVYGNLELASDADIFSCGKHYSSRENPPTNQLLLLEQYTN